MFGIKKEVKQNKDYKVNQSIQENGMYVDSLIDRLDKAVRVEGKVLHSNLMAALYKRRKSADLYRDIKELHRENHLSNSRGELHFDPMTLRGQRESASHTEKEYHAADKEYIKMQNKIKKLFNKNKLNEDEALIVKDIDNQLDNKDKELAIKVDNFYKEIQKEYSDLRKEKININKIHKLNEGLKDFAEHNHNVPSVGVGTIKLFSTAALDKIKKL